MGQEELGRLIKHAREDAGLTQPQLAEAIGVAHPQSISRYERGLTEVPAKRLRRIGHVTGKPLSFFLGTGEINGASPDQLDELLRRIEAVRAEVAEVKRLVEELREDDRSTRRWQG